MTYYTNNKQFWFGSNDDKVEHPTLMFLHGFGGGSSSYEWSKVYPAFASQYRILAPDLMGWGKSSHPPLQYQVDDYLNSLTEFIEKTCDSPITVIASSLTAAFTVRLAIARPKLFKSLILIAPAGLKDFGQEVSPLAQIFSIPVLDRLIYQAAISNEWAIESFLKQQTFARPERVYPEIVNAYLDSAMQPNAEYSALSFVRGDLSFDLATYMPQLEIPTAILWGYAAKFSRPDVGRRLSELNPKAVKVFQILEDVGLTPQLELPAVVVGLIQSYLLLLNETSELKAQ
ncbi:MAG: alpha/beta fold hydrolase [Synechococcus sp.]